MKLGKILEDELLSNDLKNIDISILMEESEYIGKLISWCVRQGYPKLCRKYLEISRKASEHLARIRITKALELNMYKNGSVDSKMLKAVIKASRSIFSFLNSNPIDPFGRVPVRALCSIERDDLRLKKNHYYMLPIDEAILLEMSNIIEIIDLLKINKNGS